MQHLIFPLSTRAVEGIMTLTDPGLRDLYDLKVFVVRMGCRVLARFSAYDLLLVYQNADSDLMLARRIRRDVRERGRDVEGILDQVSLIKKKCESP
jgi:uridine kinase